MKVVRASKLSILRFIRQKQVIEAGDLVNQYNYSLLTARNRIYRLQKAKLVEKVGIRVGIYCLTNEAIRRLEHYEQR